MTNCRKGVDQVEKEGVGRWGNIYMTLKIEMAIVKGPVREEGVREKGGTILQGRENMDDKRIGGCGSRDGLRKGEVEGIDNNQVRDNGRRVVIRRGVNVIFL